MKKITDKLKENYLAVLIFLTAVFFRFLNITKSSIWHDEGYTILMIKQNLLEITRTTAIDVHPPFFYYCLYFWSKLFGTSALAVRSMSAVFGIGVVIVVYLLVKKIFGKTTGLIAMFLTAVSPYLIRYSQEARMYGVEGFWTILGTYFLFLAMGKMKEDLEGNEKTTESVIPATKGNPESRANQGFWASQGDKINIFWVNNKFWILYALSMTAAIYTHYYAFFLIFAQWVYVILRSFYNGTRYILKKEWWLSNVAIGLMFLPWVPAVIKQFTKIQGSYWIPPVSLKTIDRKSVV